MPGTKAKAPASVKIAYEPWAKQVPAGTPSSYPWDGAWWVGQSPVHRSDAKFREVMAGRQSGKTMVGIAEICMDALLHPKHITFWVCPNYKVKPRAWRGIDEFLPAAAVKHKSQSEHPRFELANGSIIYITSADAEGSLVSESLDFVVCDEAGQWKEASWFRGIAPMLIARPHARALLIGTPRGKNWFHRLWLKGQGGDEAHQSFHWKSADSPYISASDLAEQKRNIPLDTYLQEYEADPLDNASAVFRNFKHCIRPLPAAPDQFMCLGIDLARKIDFSAIVAMNGKKQVVEVQRFQEDWSEQKQRIASSSFRLNNARMMVDASNVGDVIVQELREAGFQVEGFLFSNQTKYNLIQNLKIDFEQNRISIPDDAALIAELEAYAYEYDEDSRRFTYSAPEGQHDDLVIALALAAWGQRGVPQWFTQERSGSYLGGARRGGSYLR